MRRGESWVTAGIHPPQHYKFGQNSGFGIWSRDFQVKAQETRFVSPATMITHTTTFHYLSWLHNIR